MAYTDITQARDAYLLEVSNRIKNNDFATASDTDLILTGVLVQKFDAVNNFDPVSLTALSFIANVGDLNTYLADPSNSDAFAKILSNSQAMTAVAASSTAMTAVAASSTAWAAVMASSTAWAAVMASSTAMTAVAASSTAMTAVAASSTAMTAINANDTALSTLYASPLVTKVNYSSTQFWSSTVTLRNGIGLFVRLTTKAGVAGWGEGSTANEWMVYDGSNVTYAERNTNPYNHTATTGSPRHPARRFTSSLGIRPYQACEIAYIPLTA